MGIRNLQLKYLIAPLGLAAILFCTLFYSFGVHAISGSDFKAGNIIQDRNFYNNHTMSTAEIQAFLNAKAPTCTSGYTCLKSYTQDTPTITDSYGFCGTYAGGTKAAAQIIYDVALVCGINPQVLLTLLQKEQALVTSTQPSNTQYRSATGYGCPDTAACDANYYGFFNQLYKAAWQYRYYAANSNSYSYRPFRSNTIQWNPNGACGTSSVYIENQATAGLYIYTPYRPNAAALNNLYGLGDSCSAYGNRNFWRIFSDWFGIDNKSLIRTTTSGDLYYAAGQYKYRVTSMEIAAEYGFNTSDVAFVSQETLDSIPTSTASPYLTLVLKSDSDSDDDGGDIYLVTGGVRYRITSLDQLARFGFTTSDITYLPYYSIVRMPHGGNLSDFVQRSDGAVYKVNDGKKSAIFQLNYYNQLSSSTPPTRLSNNSLVRLATSTPLIDDYMAVRSDDGRIWLASSTSWQYVPSMQVIQCAGIDLSSIPTFDANIAIIGTTTGNVNCFSSDPSGGATYMLNGNTKYPIKAEWGVGGITPAISSSLLARQPTITAAAALSVFRDTSTGSLYTFEGGKKRYVSDVSILYELGQTPQTILPILNSVASFFANGHDRIASGRAIKNSATGQLYVMNNDKKMYITNMQTFYHFGLKTNEINEMSAGTSALYAAESSPLTTAFNIDGNTYFDDLGRRFIVPANLINDFSLQTTPMYSNGVASVAPLVASATKYLKSTSSPQLYYLETGVRRPVGSMERFAQLGGNGSNITVISDEMMGRFALGTNM